MNARIAILRPLRATVLRQQTLPFTSSQLAVRLSPHQQVQAQARCYSSESKSATGVFYKKFTRPVFKTVLLAIFTYQVVYWAWTKMEQDEIRVDRTAEAETLEQQVRILNERQKEPAQIAGEVKSSASANSSSNGKKKSWYQLW